MFLSEFLSEATLKEKSDKRKKKIRVYYWPSARSRWLDIGRVLFLRFFMDWDEYPAIFTELAWSIKDFLYGIKSSGSQSEHRICRILPARGACHIINLNNSRLFHSLLNLSHCLNFFFRHWVIRCLLSHLPLLRLLLWICGRKNTP